MDEANYQTLKEKLLSFGASEGDIEGVIDDVQSIISQKVLEEYLSTVDDPALKKMFGTSSEAEIAKYIEENQSTLPKIPEGLYREIAERTWMDYFKFMEHESQL
jgi:hypothetical protein